MGLGVSYERGTPVTNYNHLTHGGYLDYDGHIMWTTQRISAA